MLSWVLSLEKTRSCEPWKAEVAIVGRGSGLGTGNGPLCPFLLATDHQELELVFHIERLDRLEGYA